MSENNEKPKKTIDERLDALVMNFELRERQSELEAEQWRERTRQFDLELKSLRSSIQMIASHADAERVRVTELRESLLIMRDSILAQERRIERLEKRAS